MLTVNLLIDLETVVAGEYAVALSSAGQNSISSIGNSDQAFTSTPGALTIEASNQVILGDVDLSGVVDFADIPAFIQVLSSGGFQAEADIDQNGVVDFSDIGPFITILTGA